MIKPACQSHPLDTACTITAAAGDTPQKERASPALLSQHVGTCDIHSCRLPCKSCAYVLPVSNWISTVPQRQFPTEFCWYPVSSPDSQQHWRIPLASRRLLRVCQLPRCFLSTLYWHPDNFPVGFSSVVDSFLLASARLWELSGCHHKQA